VSRGPANLIWQQERSRSPRLACEAGGGGVEFCLRGGGRGAWASGAELPARRGRGQGRVRGSGSKG
jgi:hypothetical protein